jgi:hypothetical protein
LIQIELARFSEYFEKVLSNELKEPKIQGRHFHCSNFKNRPAVPQPKPFALQAQLLGLLYFTGFATLIMIPLGQSSFEIDTQWK